jgi:hypothetical protein
VSQGGTYSQYDEDRWIANLVAKLPGIPRRFIEIGCGSAEREGGIENNTMLLAQMGWVGIWCDPALKGQLCPPQVNGLAFPITVENIDCIKDGNEANVGVLSIDVDGNDYHLWKAYGPGPWIVVIEAQIQKPFDEPYVMPYNPDWVWPDDPATETYDWGASVYSLIELGRAIGYTYVGKPENPHCPNLFFVRSDLA